MYGLEVICGEGDSEGRWALNEEFEGVGSHKHAQGASKAASVVLSSRGSRFLITVNAWRI